MRNNTSVLGNILGGWMLIILSALMLALAAAFVQHKYGLGKDGVRIMVRISASLSMVLFMCSVHIQCIEHLLAGHSERLDQ